MRLIVLIDRYKQITAVANAMQLKQPTVSFHMKKMEEEWGVKLFEARTGKVLLTNNGKVLLHYASQIDALYAEAVFKLSTMSDTEKNRLVIGCTNSTAAFLIQINALAKFNTMKETSISIMVADEDELFKKLQLGTIDLVLCGDLSHEFDSAALYQQHVITSELKLIVPDDHPLVKDGVSNSQVLKEYMFAELMERSIAKSVNRWNQRQNQSMKVSQSFGSVELLLKAVKAGTSLAMLPDCILPSNEGVASISLPGEVPEWRMIASWRHNYWSHALMYRVMDILKIDEEGSDL
ncbi:LysR family transcriptional regulator [Paenibacillus sp. sgz302251]|uniref:LysR family transcriptional regulator n=1 Tax=Paenibacillus sp. sgz302251 TaxID=3414493 RepID=UPI003C7A5FEC